MKVLLYSRVFRPLVGGVETIVSALASGLARTPSVDVTLVTDTPAGRDAESSAAFAIVRQPGLWPMARRMRQSDVVHLAGPAMMPLFAALLSRRRVVVEHHGFQAACPNGQLFFEPEQKPCPGHFLAGRHLECWRCNAERGWLRSVWMWLLTFVRRWQCELADVNILPTSALDEMIRLPRSQTILHGVEAQPADRKPREADAVPRFLFVGRLVSTKGVQVLLEAAHELQQSGAAFEIRIIGEGPERRLLEARARELNLQDRVRFLGLLEDSRVMEEVGNATALVMPSLGGEVFGLSAAENMARGIPVVVSELGSLREVVGDAGLVFPPGDSIALAACLRRLIVEPELAEELGRRARARAERAFRTETMIDKHLEVYRN